MTLSRRSLSLILTLSLILAASCNDSRRSPGDANTPIPSGEGRVEGRLTDAGGRPLSGVTIAIASADVATDAEGYFSANVSPGAALVQVNDPRYTANALQVEVAEGVASLIDLRVLTRRAPQPLNASAGGLVGDRQARVSFPPASLVDGAGQAVAGDVTVQVTPLDVARDVALAPGDYSAVDASGADARLETFGMVEVVIRDPAGSPLNLAPDQIAQLAMRLPDGSDRVAGEQIALWSFDIDSGRWIEEGACTVTSRDDGLVCEGSVGHFSWWNADDPLEVTCLSGRVLDCNGDAVPGARVTARGLDYNGDSSAQSDGQGAYCLEAKRDANVQISTLGRIGEAVIGVRQSQSTSSEAQACGGGSCEPLDVILPCDPAESDFNCNDTALIDCDGCVSGRVILPADADPQGIEVVVTTQDRETRRSPLNADGSYCLPTPSNQSVEISIEGPGVTRERFSEVFVQTEPGVCPSCVEAPDIELKALPTWERCGEGITLSLTPTSVDEGFDEVFSGLNQVAGWASADALSESIVVTLLGASSEFPGEISDAHSLRFYWILPASEGVTSGDVDVSGASLFNLWQYDDGSPGVIGDPHAFYLIQASELSWQLTDGVVSISGWIEVGPGCSDRLVSARYDVALSLPLRSIGDPLIDDCSSFGESSDPLLEQGIGRVEAQLDGAALALNSPIARYDVDENALVLFGSEDEDTSFQFSISDPVPGAQTPTQGFFNDGDCAYLQSDGTLTLDVPSGLTGGGLSGTLEADMMLFDGEGCPSTRRLTATLSPAVCQGDF